MEASAKSSKVASLKIQTTNLCMKNSGGAVDAEAAEASLPSSTRRKKHHSGELFAASRSAPAVAGILYKWVNYGKGWRPRWFELEDGLLFYYKIHGPDKICINPENLRGFKIVGDEALKLLKKSKHSSADDKQSRRTFGEVHLKVCAVRESKSDEKKFYIYTGTKTLHLRAETKEERAAWMEALRTSKDLFPKDWMNLSYPPPAETLTVCTKRLREHLVNLGVDEEGIRTAEEIMAEEFSRLQQQLKIMQQKRLFLIEKLRLLEADKLELETTVVDEMQSHSATGNIVEALKDHVLRLLGADASDSDDDSGDEVAEAESDDEDFHDTRESLSEVYREDTAYTTAVDMLEDERSLSNCDPDATLDRVGFDYPYVERRKKLPEPKEMEKSVSLWSLIKDNIGKDLTRVCLPVYFNEPLSSLQKCFEDLEYSYLLDRAREWGRRGNLLMRALNVAAFAVSGYASTEGRHCKPFNPLLGETYEADYPDKGLRFISEKVSHHPMCIACHCEGQGWVISGDSTLKSKFWGRSIQLDPVGVITLQFDDGEVYQWNKVTSSINNLILGKLYVDHYGTMRIQGNRGLSCKLKFKEQSMIDRNPHQVEGFVHNEAGDKLASLIGKWDESMYYVLANPRSYQSESAMSLWQKNPPAEFPTRYNLTSFAITLNEITPGMNERLPPTDSRLRPDQQHLENGEFDLANAEKQRLEYKQRQARKVQETGWTPRWFRKVGERYEYTGTYWETRELGQWDGCPDIFGPDIAL